jgi:hypothetical protein
MQLGNIIVHHWPILADKMLYNRKRSNPVTAMQLQDGNSGANSNFPPLLGFNAKNLVLAVRTTESGVSHMKSNSRISKPRISLMGIALLMLSLPLPALAALGGDVASVHEDQAQMKGSLKTTEAMTYTVHEIKGAAGTVVREYVSPAGDVFGVSWQGPDLPNMQQILGSYFHAFSTAAQAQRTVHRARGPLNIQQPGLVVESGGHIRAYSGRAYDPGKLPQGVSANDIR